MSKDDSNANQSPARPSNELTPIEIDTTKFTANASAAVSGSEPRPPSARNGSRPSTGKRHSRAAVAPMEGPDSSALRVSVSYSFAFNMLVHSSNRSAFTRAASAGLQREYSTNSAAGEQRHPSGK